MRYKDCIKVGQMTNEEVFNDISLHDAWEEEL
jgi:hypothetical protein